MIQVVSSIVALLLIAAIVHGVAKRFNLPFTVLLVLVGIGLNLLARPYPHLLQAWRDVELSPPLILYVFLPSIIFESAFNLDARQLREDLAPVMMLAVPGLLLSTAIIGGLVFAATAVPLTAALLLGAILSATDPVAVIAVFKRLGVPARLRLLVEGESLFNDASSLVVARLILGVLIGGTISNRALVSGLGAFFVVFFGGLLTGWVLGRITGYALGRVEDNFIEITLTTVLAYISFIVAEQFLHVSGIMATIAAGLAIGGWGRIKISAPVRSYLEHFWEYIAFVANALIFLLVGLRVDLRALAGAGSLFLWVVLALLVSRAVVVYGMMPLIERLPGVRPISKTYQTAIYWGGLRGAIALAIVLSLPQFDQRESFIAVVMGAVLFTLLANGLTIQPLVRRLKLDRPLLADRLARMEGDFIANQKALSLLPDLVVGGLVSRAVSSRLQQQFEEKLQRVKAEIEELHGGELNDDDRQRALLHIRVLAEERSLYIRMFDRRQIGEPAFRQLIFSLERQIDVVRETSRYAESGLQMPLRLAKELNRRVHWLSRLTQRVAKQLFATAFVTAYEVSDSRYESSRRVLGMLDELARVESTPWYITDKMRRQYQSQRDAARLELDHLAQEHPELVADWQDRLGKRLLLLAKAESIIHQADAGTLSPEAASGLIEEIHSELHDVKRSAGITLDLEPIGLLSNWPPFRSLSTEDLAYIAIRLRLRPVAEGEEVVKQSQTGDEMYFVKHGTLRASQLPEGPHQTLPDADREVAMLIAGDWFGEEAILDGRSYDVTVRAATACSLYVLGRVELDVAMGNNPAILKALGREPSDVQHA